MSNDESKMESAIKISTFGVMLENLKVSFVEHLNRQDRILERIEAKLTIQNGRVGKSEEDIRNLHRLSSEALVTSLAIQQKQLDQSHAIARVKRTLWRFATTITILAGVGFGVVWCLDHGILEFKPSNYQAVAP